LKGRGVVGWVGSIAFTGDSRLLAIANHGSVVFYDVASGLPQIGPHGSPTHTGLVRQVRFSPDGRFLATAANENVVKIWDSRLPAPPDLLTVAGGSNFVSLSRDEQTLLAGSSTVKFWDLPSGREARSWALEQGEAVVSTLSPDGRLIATNHPDRTVKVRDLATGEEVARTAPMARPPAYAAAFSPDSRTFAIAALEPLSIWELPGTNRRFSESALPGAYVVAFAPDGKLLATGSLSETVRLVDLGTGELLKSFAAGSSWSTAVAFTPDSRLLATANSDGTLKLWDSDQGTLKGALRGHGDVVTSLTFFTGGRTLVTGTEDGAVRLWDMTTRQELLTFHDHRSMVNGAAVKRDGSMLATNSVDGHVRLYHAQHSPEATAARTELDPEDPLSPARQLDAAEQFWASGHSADARAACEAAQLRLQTLIERSPQVPPYRRELVRSWLVASLIDASPENSRPSNQSLQNAVDLYRRLPGNVQKSLLHAYVNLGGVIESRGEHDRACQLFTHLRVFFERLATAEPKAVEYRARAALAEGHAASVFEKAKQLPEALAACALARNRLDKLREEFADDELRLGELADAWLLIGTVLRSCRKYPEAIAAFSRAIEIQPDYPVAWWHRAYTLAASNECEAAIRDYDKCIELQPDLSEGWNNRGVCYSRLGQMELAAADFERAAERQQGNETLSRHNLARTHVNLGQYDLALSDYTTAIDANPTSAELRIGRGAIFARLSRWDEAAADYSKALELQPNDVATVIGLAGTLHSAGKIGEAIGWYRKAVDLAPENAGIHLNLGRLLVELDKLDEARRCFEKALQLDPKRAEVHSNLGDLLRKQGAEDEAIASYQRAIGLEPKFATAHSSLGDMFLSEGRFDEAVARFETALELNPQLTEGHRGLGNARFALGQWDEAAVCFKRALQLDPNNAPASTSFAEALFRAGRFDEAVAAYRRAIELNLGAWHKFVDSFQDSGRLSGNEKGIEEFTTACRKQAEANPGSPRLVLELAQLITSAGRIPETLALWEKLVDPSSGTEAFRSQLAYKLSEIANQSSVAGRHDESENAIRGSLVVFEKLATDFPANAWYRHEQGFAYFLLGGRLLHSPNRLPQAEGAFRQALAIYTQLTMDDPKNVGYRLRVSQCQDELAAVLARQGKNADAEVEWENAIGEATKAIEEKPDESGAWSTRAFIHFHRQEWDKAIADFSKAIELAPQVHTNWWHRGHCYLNLAQWDKAAANFGKVIEQWPEGGEGWCWHAVALAQSNQPEQAMADLRQAIARGWMSVDWLKNDSRFGPLRGREDFADLLGKVERRQKLQFTHKGRWAEAIADYTNALKLVPNDVAVWRARAEAYIDLVLWPEAVADYAAAFQLQEPADSLTFFQHALLRRCLEDEPGYKVACERMLARFADSPDPDDWNNAAAALAISPELGVEPSRAVALAERAVAQNKLVWRVAYLGMAHYRAGEFERAATALEESLTIDPNWNPSWVHAALAMARQGLGSGEQASAALERARSARDARVDALLAGGIGFWPCPWWDAVYGELLYREAYALVHGSPPPDDPRLYILRGRGLETIGRADEARAEFAKAFAVEPNDLLIRVQALPPVSQSDAFAAGLADLRVFLKEHPDQPEGGRLALAHAHLQWGARQWREGRREDAEVTLGQVTDLAPASALPLIERGNLWFSFDQTARAIGDYSLALEQVQEAASRSLIYQQRGTAHSRLGHHADARDDWQQAVDLMPSSAEPNNKLAWLLATCADATLRDSHRAVALAARAVELQPNQGMYWNTLGVSRYRAGDWSPAIEALSKSTQFRQGGDAFDWFFLAMAEWQLGRKDEARKWFDEALKWTQKNAASNEELQQFQSEATELLGIAPPARKEGF
jgi:tetratricopeptide (TPR) repeat protein/WD40 repeat protein